LLLNLHGNVPLEKAQFKVIFDFQEHHDVVDVKTLLEYITNYCRVGQDDPNGGESRCEILGPNINK
jgi:hypothetical protein